MKVIINIICITLLLAFTISSCNNKTEDELNVYNIGYSLDREFVVTNKILYDVPIENDELIDKTQNNPDWFWENIPSPDNLIFLEKLLEDAISGKQKTYYYVPDGDYESFTEIPESKRSHFMDSVLTYTCKVVDDEKTTENKLVIKHEKRKLTAQNIKKLRFLEEWYLENNVFKKRVIAVAPFFNIDINEEESINSIFFWILLNENEEPIN